MDLILFAGIFCFALISIGLPFIFSPLAVTGFISYAPLYSLHVQIASILMFFFTFSLVIVNMVRSEHKHHRGWLGVFIGGFLTLATLGVFGASVLGHIDQQSLFSLDLLNRKWGVMVIWPIAYLFFFMAVFAHGKTAFSFYTFILFIYSTGI